MTFIDEKNVDDENNEDHFNLDLNKDIATFPNPTDFKDELLGIEMESINNIENKLLMSDLEEDMNDLT